MVGIVNSWRAVGGEVSLVDSGFLLFLVTTVLSVVPHRIDTSIAYQGPSDMVHAVGHHC